MTRLPVDADLSWDLDTVRAIRLVHPFCVCPTKEPVRLCWLRNTQYLGRNFKIELKQRQLQREHGDDGDYVVQDGDSNVHLLIVIMSHDDYDGNDNGRNDGDNNDGAAEDIEDITWPRGERERVKYLFNTRREISYLQVAK